MNFTTLNDVVALLLLRRLKVAEVTVVRRVHMIFNKLPSKYTLTFTTKNFALEGKKGNIGAQL